MTNQIRFLIDCLIEQMALMLMNDYNMSITDALDTVFTSFMRRSKILKPDYTIKAQNIIMNYSVMK